MGDASLPTGTDAVECVGQCEGVIALHPIGQVAVAVVALALLNQIVDVLAFDGVAHDESAWIELNHVHLESASVVLHLYFVSTLSVLAVVQVKGTVSVPHWVGLEGCHKATSTELNAVDVGSDDFNLCVLWLGSVDGVVLLASV